jgi:hypothetical protein
MSCAVWIGRETFNGFIFDDNQVIENHVNSVTCIILLSIISDWEEDFSSPFAEYIGMTLLISGFEQPWPEFFVNLEGSIDNVFSNFFNVIRHSFLQSIPEPPSS